MKQLKLIITLVSIVVVVNSCKIENPVQYTVSVLSATIQRDGGVRMEGMVNETEQEVRQVGFWSNNFSDGNEAIRYLQPSEFKGNRFTATFFPRFNKEHIYYFRSWVYYKDKKISSANSFVLDSIDSIRDCLKQPNTVSCAMDASIYPYSGKSEFLNTTTGIYEMSRSTNFGPTVELRFGSDLKDGVYTTVDRMPDIGTNTVYVYFSSASDPAIKILDAGSTVQVNMKTPGSYEIIICNAPWKSNLKSFTFSTRIRVG